MYWFSNGAFVFINWGNNAAKNIIAFGLLPPTTKPLKKDDNLSLFSYPYFYQNDNFLVLMLML